MNCIVRTPDGLPWELQFHTAASYAMKDRTHDGYEIMRDPYTPSSLRRHLFEKTVRIVDTLAIPRGILEPTSLHAAEELKLLPVPAP